MKRAFIIILVLFSAAFSCAKWGIIGRPGPTTAGAAPLADAPTGACGNVTVSVQDGQTATLCSGFTVSAAAPVASVRPLITSGTCSNVCYYYSSCTWVATWVQQNITFTVTEDYAEDYYSNIDPGFSDPPTSMVIDISPLAAAAGYTDGGTNGFANPTAYFGSVTSDTIAQLGVFAQGHIDWFAPTLVVRTATLDDGYVNSPAFDPTQCTNRPWTFSEVDIITSVGNALCFIFCEPGDWPVPHCLVWCP